MYNNIKILNNTNFPEIVNSIKIYLSNKNIKIEIISDLNEIKNSSDSNLIILIDRYEQLPSDIFNSNNKILNLHFSLLPSFKVNNAINEAFKSGIKVSGITIHQIKQNNFYDEIIAQYPILIGLSTHFDEYLNEIIKISSSLYPLVINSVFNDILFDFTQIISNSCNNNCKHDCKQCKNE